jgi:hypothetical protein
MLYLTRAWLLALSAAPAAAAPGGVPPFRAGGLRRKLAAMKRLARLALLILTCSCGSAPSGAPLAADRPDLLVITVGALDSAAFEPARRDGLQLPALDALLAQDIGLRCAVVPASSHDANLASLFTGLHPRRHGALFFFYGLGQEHTTLAERLSAAGYRTGGFSVLNPTADSAGFDQGFDAFEAPSSADIDTLRRAWPNGRVVESAAAWLRTAQQQDQPWFCWIHLNVRSIVGRELSPAEVRCLPPEVAQSPTFERFRRNGELPDMGTFMTDIEPWLRRLTLVSLDEDLQPLAPLLGRRQRLTLFTALRGTPGPGSPVPPLEAMWHVPLVLAGASAGVAGADERPASLLDVMPTLLGQAGIRWASPDEGLDLLSGGQGGERLRVHDDYDLEGETSVAVRRGERALWVAGEHAGLSLRSSDVSHPLTEEEETELRAAYGIWSAARPGLDRLRRPELDARWLRAIEEKLPEIERELELGLEGGAGSDASDR